MTAPASRYAGRVTEKLLRNTADAQGLSVRPWIARIDHPLARHAHVGSEIRRGARTLHRGTNRECLSFLLGYRAAKGTSR